MLLIIGGAGRWIQQTMLRSGDLIEQPLRIRRVGSRLPASQQGHSTLCSRFDHIGIRFIKRHAQQPIVVRGLLVRRNAEPLVIGIKRAWHCGLTEKGLRRITQFMISDKGALCKIQLARKRSPDWRSPPRFA